MQQEPVSPTQSVAAGDEYRQLEAQRHEYESRLGELAEKAVLSDEEQVEEITLEEEAPAEGPDAAARPAAERLGPPLSGTGPALPPPGGDAGGGGRHLERVRHFRRGTSILPSLFTTGNLFLGFWAIVKTLDGQIASLEPATAVAWFGQNKSADGKWVSAGCFKQGFFVNEANLSFSRSRRTFASH